MVLRFCRVLLASFALVAFTVLHPHRHAAATTKNKCAQARRAIPMGVFIPINSIERQPSGEVKPDRAGMR